MGKQTEAIICIVLGVLFAASAIAMYLTSDHEAAKKVIEKSKSNKPTKEEKKKDKIESKEEVKEADIEKSEEDKEE